MSSTFVDQVVNATSAFIEPLTVEQYHAMIRQGILVEGAPIELIDGLLVRKDRRDKEGSILTVGPRHAFVVKTICRLLGELLQGHRCHVQSQQPVTLNGIQEPEPDVAVVNGHEDDFRDHHPGPGDVPLVIEVADSSLAFDRGEKLKKYAAAGIPVYGIVNLNEELVEVHTQPEPQSATYADRTDSRRGEMLAFEVAGNRFELPVSDILS